jgi:hypothetical protein
MKRIQDLETYPRKMIVDILLVLSSRSQLAIPYDFMHSLLACTNHAGRLNTLTSSDYFSPAHGKNRFQILLIYLRSVFACPKADFESKT